MFERRLMHMKEMAFGMFIVTVFAFIYLLCR
jgi:hypothetical protein